jgi:hypothetical protein
LLPVSHVNEESVVPVTAAWNFQYEPDEARENTPRFNVDLFGAQ